MHTVFLVVLSGCAVAAAAGAGFLEFSAVYRYVVYGRVQIPVDRRMGSIRGARRDEHENITVGRELQRRARSLDTPVGRQDDSAVYVVRFITRGYHDYLMLRDGASQGFGPYFNTVHGSDE